MSRYYKMLIVANMAYLSACVPYVGYTHLSNPNIRGDGYDLVCGGVKNENIRVAACNNVNDGQGMVKVDLEYEL